MIGNSKGGVACRVQFAKCSSQALYTVPLLKQRQNNRGCLSILSKKDSHLSWTKTIGEKEHLPKLPSLKLTGTAPESWNTILSFLGPGLFSGVNC